MSVHETHAKAAKDLIDQSKNRFQNNTITGTESILTMIQANTLATLALYELVKEGENNGQQINCGQS